MSEDRHRRAAETALRRRAGMSADKARAVQRTFEAQDDLFTTCRRCGERRQGTLAELMMDHGCGR